MKRHGVPLGALLVWVVLGGQVYAVDVKTDAIDSALRSISAVYQQLDNQLSEIAERIDETVRLKKALREVLNALDEQVPKLRDLLSGANEDLKGNDLNDLKEKIDAIDEQIGKLKEQVKKLELVLKKIDTLMPKLEDALGQDQSAEESRRILDAISQDRAKVSKLLQAIEENKPAEIGNLLKQGARGSKVEVREVKNADGATVVFRVGNLIQCLSTKSQCGGKSSSVTKAAGAVPSAAEAIKPLKDALIAAGKQAAAHDRAIDSLQSDLKAALGASNISQDQVLELQNAANQVAEAATARSNMAQKLAAAIESLLSRFH